MSATPATVSAAVRPRSIQLAHDLFELTKPKVQSLLLLTTVTSMYVAGLPSLSLVVLTVLGGYMCAGAAGAVNHWYDRDIDIQMSRTADRPIPSGRVSPALALGWGAFLLTASMLLLGLTVNWLTAALSMAGFVWYVFVYTMWLKRTTPQNIVWGGAAGAFPAMAGWSAVQGNITVTSVALFAIVFLWTPPHFWALSLLMKDEYAKVNVPMLPVVRGEDVTRNWISISTVVLVASSLVPYFTEDMGGRYLSTALILGAVFIIGSELLRRHPSRQLALRVYLFSLLYLALLFGGMVCDLRL
ncbi:MAG: protoheme IX farnesyltransferase [Solirubrobacteraceae bacterium]|nr:protoheme IX farnesyltransferase [Solirubrobacteraceae bacterium]